MHTSRPHGRGRFVAAIVVSLSLHALVGVCWLYAPTGGAAGGQSIEETVDVPAEDTTTVVLRDRPPERVTIIPATPPEPVSAKPDPLPPSVTAPSTPAASALAPVSGSPAPPSDLPKSGGSQPLHGKKSGRTIVYVLDRSSSMGPDRQLQRAIAVVKSSLEELGPDTRFQIVAYNRQPTSMASQPVPPTTAARDRAESWLAALVAEGSSNHKGAFQEALSMRPDEVYLLTDADDLEESDLRGVALRTPVRISAAVFGGNRPAVGTPLERLAARTGGSVRYVGP
jgi:hypothetical protein